MLKAATVATGVITLNHKDIARENLNESLCVTYLTERRIMSILSVRYIWYIVGQIHTAGNISWISCCVGIYVVDKGKGIESERTVGMQFTDLS